jgi:hypothetical protein
VFKLIQRKLTFVDLGVDPAIGGQYQIARQLWQSFAGHFDLAELEPLEPYTPYAPVTEAVRDEHPARYRLQGIPIGLLDVAAEALLVTDDTGAPPFMSFGRFESEYQDKNSTLHRQFALVAAVFLDFHPRTRPILWRTLVVQAHLHKAMIRCRQSGGAVANGKVRPLVLPMSEDERRVYDWRQAGEPVSAAQVLGVLFTVAETYVRQRLGALFAP